MKKRQYIAEFKKDAAHQIIIEGVAVKEGTGTTQVRHKHIGNT